MRVVHVSHYESGMLCSTLHYLCILVHRLQEERLEVICQVLKQREVDHQALNDKRLEYLWYVQQLFVISTACNF